MRKKIDVLVARFEAVADCINAITDVDNNKTFIAVYELESMLTKKLIATRNATLINEFISWMEMLIYDFVGPYYEHIRQDPYVLEDYEYIIVDLSILKGLTCKL